MNSKMTLVMLCGTIFAAGVMFQAVPQETSAAGRIGANHPVYEYASIRFNEEKTSIVWPDGTVENLLAISAKQNFDNRGEKYPKGADYRMYWLTVGMNLLGKQGFEFSYMNNIDLVMKRQLSR